MKTDDFISMLATGVTPVDRHVQRKSLGLAILIGATAALLMMIVLFGLRPDIRVMLVTPLFWIKLAVPAVLAVLSLRLLLRVSRPGMPRQAHWLVLAPGLPILAVWLAALVLLFNAPPELRWQLIMGLTWRVCPLCIVLLSLPLCVTITHAVRQMAPTRLRLAGAASGMLASSVATMAYCLHCPEMSPAFWGVWYFLGMLIPAVAGAILGPRLLRW